LKRANLPVIGPDLGAERYLDLMAHDKKVVDGQLRLVLLKGLGNGITWSQAPRSEIVAAIETCCHE
jgi:3-dehydroquinate synthase